MKTFQDFQVAVSQGATIDFIKDAITEHRSSSDYVTALNADEYEAQRNVTINAWQRILYTQTGEKVPDFTAPNNRLANNFFHRLNTQRRCYSLGNGVSFTKNTEKVVVDGVQTTVDKTKEFLGTDFDTMLDKAAYYALIHGVSFPFWNLDSGVVFKLTEFVPLWDENTGALMAGIRFWSLDWSKRPVTVVLYEIDGYTQYKTKAGSTGLDLEMIEDKRAYKQTVSYSEADGEEIVGESNYSDLPIVPLWGNKNHQSTLVGMQSKLDSYDLIDSGFANDLEECAEIYWIVNNAMGMTDQDLAKFRDRIKMQHIAVVDSDTPATPYTQDIPTTSRTAFLTEIRNQLYEDFGALDVHTVAAGATNDHIDAAYQPMDEEADDFEYQIIQCVRQILKVNGIDDVPVFKRNRISNQKEQVEMVSMVAQHLDEETLLSKLPFLSVDEVQKVLANKDKQNASMLKIENIQEDDNITRTGEEVNE